MMFHRTSGKNGFESKKPNFDGKRASIEDPAPGETVPKERDGPDFIMMPMSSASSGKQSYSRLDPTKSVDTYDPFSISSSKKEENSIRREFIDDSYCRMLHESSGKQGFNTSDAFSNLPNKKEGNSSSIEDIKPSKLDDDDPFCRERGFDLLMSRMLEPSSGKIGFDPLSPQAGDKVHWDTIEARRNQSLQVSNQSQRAAANESPGVNDKKTAQPQGLHAGLKSLFTKSKSSERCEYVKAEENEDIPDEPQFVRRRMHHSSSGKVNRRMHDLSSGKHHLTKGKVTSRMRQSSSGKVTRARDVKTSRLNSRYKFRSHSPVRTSHKRWSSSSPENPGSKRSRSSRGKSEADFGNHKKQRPTRSPSRRSSSSPENSAFRRSRSRMSSRGSGKEGYDLYSRSPSPDCSNRKRQKSTSCESSEDSGDVYVRQPTGSKEESWVVDSDSDQANVSAVNEPGFVRDRPLVVRMLRREQNLRMSEETQKLYDGGREGKVIAVPPGCIEHSIQLQVLREHGILPTKVNLHWYRCLNGMYLNDPEVRENIVYMKHDYSRRGDLREGHDWPDVSLTTLDQQPMRLSDVYRDKSKPLIVLGASRS